MQSKEEYKKVSKNRIIELIEKHEFNTDTLIEILYNSYADGFQDGYQASQDDYYS